MEARRTILGALVGIITAVSSVSPVTSTATILGSAAAVTMLAPSEALAKCGHGCRMKKARGRLVRGLPASIKMGPHATNETRQKWSRERPASLKVGAHALNAARGKWARERPEGAKRQATERVMNFR